MKLKSVIESQLFKVRYIYQYTLKPFDTDSNVKHISMIDYQAIQSLSERATSELNILLNKRLHDPSWIVFIYEKGFEILGYSFLHIPKKTEWHDSLPTKFGEARIGSNFVYPMHRGKRIRGSICKQQINYAHKANLRVWSVVEKSNVASIAAEKPYAQVYSHNYLIKFLGKNLISILSNPFQIHFLLGYKNERR